MRPLYLHIFNYWETCINPKKCISIASPNAIRRDSTSVATATADGWCFDRALWCSVIARVGCATYRDSVCSACTRHKNRKPFSRFHVFHFPPSFVWCVHAHAATNIFPKNHFLFPRFIHQSPFNYNNKTIIIIMVRGSCVEIHCIFQLTILGKHWADPVHVIFMSPSLFVQHSFANPSFAPL